MFIALTGTPGTGKTTAARILASRGHTTLTVEELAREHGCLEATGGGMIVDVEKLASGVSQPSEDIILVGHLAHFIPGRMCIVLRCHPDIIGRRLDERGYAAEKVRENTEAEAVDLILSEAVEEHLFVFEINTTSLSPDGTADAIERIMNGETDDYPPGKADWSRAVMDWY